LTVAAFAAFTYGFLPLFFTADVFSMLLFITIFILLLIGIPLILFPLRLETRRLQMNKIIENDLGLPGERVESYSYPQVERHFFLSIISGLLLVETVVLYLVMTRLADGKHDPFVSALILGVVASVVLITTIYYRIGRYFLEICRTKQNYLAAPPLVDNPFAIALTKAKNPHIPDDPLKKSGVSRLASCIALIGLGVWYFSFYSWDKHPIPLGIGVLLSIVVFWHYAILKEWNRWLRNTYIISITGLMMLALHYIEFGVFNFIFSDSPVRADSDSRDCQMLNESFLQITLPMLLFFNVCRFFEERRKKRHSQEQESDRDKLLREAIAKFDPAMMIADEPEVAAQPFPRHWIWIIGLYAAVIAAVFCVGVLIQ
jgi:hypothetical protein